MRAYLNQIVIGLVITILGGIIVGLTFGNTISDKGLAFVSNSIQIIWSYVKKILTSAIPFWIILLGGVLSICVFYIVKKVKNKDILEKKYLFEYKELFWVIQSPDSDYKNINGPVCPEHKQRLSSHSSYSHIGSSIRCTLCKYDTHTDRWPEDSYREVKTLVEDNPAYIKQKSKLF